MTLAEILARHPERFARQTWYADEPFLRRVLDGSRGLPVRVVPQAEPPVWRQRCPWVVELADLYVRYPEAPLWHGFLWCADVDRWGQRIFVGGTQMSRGYAGTGLFQIHRQVRLTEDWGIPVWA